MRRLTTGEFDFISALDITWAFQKAKAEACSTPALRVEDDGGVADEPFP
jgi:hypothetical protein